MKNSSPKIARFAVLVLSLAFFSSLIFLEHFLFQRFFGRSYFNIWIEQGPWIVFSLTLIGLVWDDLDKQHPELVSAHPAYYLRTCLVIMSGVFLAFANSLPGKRSMANIRASQISTFRLLYDFFIGFLFYLLLVILAGVWFLCVAPSMYFMTLITGAPARLALLSKSEQISLEISQPDSKGAATSTSFFLSFSGKPVTMTEAITAGLLMLIQLSDITG